MQSFGQKLMDSTNLPVDSSAPHETEVRQELTRILSRDLFLKSPQLSRFLRFCVEETLEGRQDGVKEQVLGTDVFRRPSPFDPRLDPIVRVEARRLRAKLDQYYASEGAADPVIISFQRGDYVPRFVRPSLSDRATLRTKVATIVVVEDERLVARDLEIRLTNLGYKVVGSAASGEAALRQIEESQPDIVLMDIVLAGTMRGTEVARRIWTEWQIPVVYLTAFSDPMILEDVKGSEPYGYVLKPFDSKQLHAVLQLALSRRDRETRDQGHGDGPLQSKPFLTRVTSAATRSWKWHISDPSLPWPECADGSVDSDIPDPKLSPSRFLDHVAPVDREHVREAFTAAIQSGQNVEIKYRKLDQDNATEWAFATGTVVKEAAGGLLFSGSEVRAAPTLRPAKAEVAVEGLAAGASESHTQSEADRPSSPVSNLLTYTRLAGKRN